MAATKSMTSSEARGSEGRTGWSANRLASNILLHSVWLWLAILCVIFGMLNPFFLTLTNLKNVLIQATVLGLLGMAQAMPLLVAEIDLSIAGNIGFSSVVGALSISELGLPTGLGILLGIGTATLIGMANGIFVTRLRMVSLIETLGMMIILQGALLAISQGKTITDLPDAYTWIGQATLLTWPIMPLVLILVYVVMTVVLRRTVLGRSLYATGGNAQAAFTAGIRTDRVKIIAFAISGLLTGIAGYLLAAWQMAITSDQGQSYLLYSIAGPIIGGVSVFGGRGNTLGIFGGILLLTVIDVGLAITAVPSFYVTMAGGILIFVAVAVDAIRVNFLSRA